MLSRECKGELIRGSFSKTSKAAPAIFFLLKAMYKSSSLYLGKRRQRRKLRKRRKLKFGEREHGELKRRKRRKCWREDEDQNVLEYEGDNINDDFDQRHNDTLDDRFDDAEKHVE